MQTINFKDLLLPNFWNFWQEAKNPQYLYYICKGGRNSGKSWHIAAKIVCNRMTEKSNAIVVRKVGNTLKDSCVEQIQNAIDLLGVSHLWHFAKTTYKFTYLPTGTKIIFRGADKPEKIKSLVSAGIPFADLWLEEVADFVIEDEIDTIVQSLLRAELTGGLRYRVFMSYNPPKRKMSWVNKRFNSALVPDNVYVHHSTYLQNTFVSKETVEEAQNLRKRNIQKYKWIFMGRAIGGGINPFDSLKFETITDEQIESFDNIRMGIDWGYANDAFAFVRMHYDKTRNSLYFIDELYGIKRSNKSIIDWILKKGYNDRYTAIIADSAEPKSISQLRDSGIYISSAKKGAGSVEYGEKWLDELDAIYIDTMRTPNICSEFESIDYQIDRFGEIRSRLEDKNNHTIDATRYAMEGDMTYQKSVYF
jgi:PBSX family phage terminase large subunit